MMFAAQVPVRGLPKPGSRLCSHINKTGDSGSSSA